MKKFLASLLTCAALSMSTMTQAHDFYYTVDVTSAIQTDDNKNMTGLKQTWLYSKDVSDIMLEGWDYQSAEFPDQVVKELGDQVVEDLVQWSYFTELRANGNPVERMTISDYNLSLSNGRLKLELVQPLDKPLKLAGTKLEIDMADPAGTGLFVHGSANNVKVPSGCSTEMTQVQAVPPDDKFEHGKPVQLMTVTCK